MRGAAGGACASMYILFSGDSGWNLSSMYLNVEFPHREEVNSESYDLEFQIILLDETGLGQAGRE